MAKFSVNIDNTSTPEDNIRRIAKSFYDEILPAYKDLLRKQNAIGNSAASEINSLVDKIRTAYDEVWAQMRGQQSFAVKTKNAMVDIVNHALTGTIQSTGNYARTPDLYKQLIDYINNIQINDNLIKIKLTNAITEFTDKIHDSRYRNILMRDPDTNKRVIEKHITEKFPETDDNRLNKKDIAAPSNYNEVFKPLFNIKTTLSNIKANAGRYEDLIDDVRFDGIFWNKLKNFVTDLPTIYDLKEGMTPGDTINIAIKNKQPYKEILSIVNNFGSARGVEKGNVEFVLQNIRKEFKDNIDKFIDNVCNIAYNKTSYDAEYQNLIQDADKLVRIGQDVTGEFINNLYDVFENISSDLGRSVYVYFNTYSDVKEFMIQILNDLYKRIPDDIDAEEKLKRMVTNFRTHS